jgi:sugar phosphate isomerase/epimerase
MPALSRRRLLASACAALGTLALPRAARALRFGLVTYLWGADWDLATLIASCEAAGLAGVELRTTHAHGVEPSLDAAARREVRRRFDASPVVFVGPGSDEKLHHQDPARVRRAIDAAKAFLVLSHDLGGTGVKVKPDALPDDEPRERTIERIGAALRELGDYAAPLDQELRLEVHGRGTSDLAVIRAIVAAADHERVRVCWNSNPEDLAGDGLAASFELVRAHLGATVHVRELDRGDYPYDELFRLLVSARYAGFVLFEGRDVPADRIAGLVAQRQRFEALVQAATADER